MSKINKRVLFVLMPNDFQDVEFIEPYNMILAEGHNVDVAGLKQRSIAVGSNGYKHKPNKILFEMGTQDFDNYDAIIIPGGIASPDFLWENEELQDVIRYFHENEKIVATICYASIVPVQAEILTNQHATVFPTEKTKNILEEHDVIFSDEECVVLPGKKIITCQGPTSAKDFGKAILSLLDQQE
jgi:protease I